MIISIKVRHIVYYFKCWSYQIPNINKYEQKREKKLQLTNRSVNNNNKLQKKMYLLEKPYIFWFSKWPNVFHKSTSNLKVWPHPCILFHTPYKCVHAHIVFAVCNVYLRVCNNNIIITDDKSNIRLYLDVTV